MKKKTTFSLDAELLEKLKSVSESEHRSQTAIIELALMDYFKKQEK